MRTFLLVSLGLVLASLVAFERHLAGEAREADLTAEAAWSETENEPSSVQVMMTPVVGDLDHDGAPEIAFISFVDYADVSDGEDGILRVVSGRDGAERWSVVDPGCRVCAGDASCTELDARGQAGVLAPGAGLALADLDGDGSGEILALLEGAAGARRQRVAAFRSGGSLLWCSEQLAAPLDPYTHIAVADIEGDGSVDIVAGSTLLSADGFLRWDGGRARTSLASAIADLDGDGAQEIITGGRAFRADGTLAWDRTDLAGAIHFPAIADFDGDGSPEVVSVDRDASRLRVLEGTTGATRCEVSIAVEGSGSEQFGGPPVLVDIDEDCVPEIGVASLGALTLFAYVEPGGGQTDCLQQIWQRTIQDQTSAESALAAGDLDGDGRAELVHGDEQMLRVLDAASGDTLASTANPSATGIENPVIVDADADGEAEIVAVASDYLSGEIHGVRILRDPAAAWARARRLWNQHAYHRNNIGDDLSVPEGPTASWREHNHYRAQLGRLCGDGDGDGVLNPADNCPDVANPEQENADGDPAGTACDCDDDDARVWPGAAQLCDGVNNDCDDPLWPELPPSEMDADADGALACADCDDDAPSICPGCEQLCDGINNDCDDPLWPAVPGEEYDDDGDGTSDCDGDCDDGDASVYAGAPQLCDGINNDCEDPLWPAVPADESDADADAVRICAGDCDDDDASVYPGAPQVCDGVNNDCDDPDWPTAPADEADADEDGHRVCGGDCDDTVPTTFPGADEICNGVDDDCNELVDDDEFGEDSDADGVHNACDNCPFDENPLQEDGDGDVIGDACDNCEQVVNPTQKDGDADEIGNACDNCPHRANPDQADGDADGAGDLCDNCAGLVNESQHDLDDDGEGDECDLDDGVILFERIEDPGLSWQSDPAYFAFAIYRGDLSVLVSGGDYSQVPGSNDYAERFCDLAEPSLDDPLRPSAREALYWLVTGEGASGESALGDGTPVDRPNANPCP